MKRELDGLITQMHNAGIAYDEAVRQFKKRYIFEVLAHHKGNQCKAAIELGMHRNTLSRTLAELDMDTTQIRTQIRTHLRDKLRVQARTPLGDNIRSGMRRPPASERPVVQNIATAR